MIHRRIFFVRTFSCALLCFFAVATGSFAVVQEDTSKNFHPKGDYSLVRLIPQSWDNVEDLEELGVEIDHGVFKKGQYIETVADDLLIAELRSLGHSVTVLQSNLQETLAARLEAEKELPVMLGAGTPANFRLGSMGGFYTLDEIHEEYEKMRLFAPEIVSLPRRIATTHEGREVNAYLFADTASLAETAPAILYTSLHHAREPGSATTIVYFLWDLLERYKAGDAEAAFLLRNRKIWVVPCVNPDGYEFNRREFPNGGGMWRKNRRPFANNNFGVDLNRNYGPMEAWNAANGGSSDNPRSDTYRGTAPFSEPEIAGLRDFCLEHNFAMAYNYHTFSNLLVYPYGYRREPPADSTFFHSFAAEVSRSNLYSAGTDMETVGYSTRGVSDDWMYIATNTRAFTPEVGTVQDFFWPSRSRIAEHGRENLHSNYQAAWSGGANLRPIEHRVSRSFLDTAESKLVLTIQNIGVQRAAPGSRVEIKSLSPNLTLTPASQEIASLQTTVSQTFLWDIGIRPPLLNGDRTPVEVTIYQDGVPRRDTLLVQAQRPTVNSLFDGTLAGWSSDRWGVVRDPRTGANALFDSFEPPLPRSANYITRDREISLDDCLAATLVINTRWSIEANGDFGVVQVSDDGGQTWHFMRSSLMKEGTFTTPNNPQQRGTFGFDGNFPRYVRQEFDLNRFVGKNILIRFGMLTDPSNFFEGWYINDVELYRFYDIPVSVALLPKDDEVRIAPIPARTHITITLPTLQAGEPIEYSLFDMRGTLLEKGEQKAYPASISLSTASLPTGVYFIVLHHNHQLIKRTFRVLK